MPTVSQPLPSAAPPKGKRRKGLIITGLIILVGGVLGGGAIAAKGTANYEDAVRSLARAPVGCTTTLVFDKASTFTIYAETKGTLGDLGGDCEASGGAYEHAGDKLPKLALTLEDGNGDAVTLVRGVSASYDVDGYVGTGVRTVSIEEPGTYHLNVESDESDFAVSIGKNPKDDYDLMMVIGGSVALAGFVLGLLLFLLGLRRRRPDPAMATIRNPAAPMPGWPPGPYAGAPPAAPPAPPMQPGFTPAAVPAPPTIQLPGQPPIRLPETPPGSSFAPPSFAPPAPPGVAPSSPPTGQPPPPPAADDDDV